MIILESAGYNGFYVFQYCRTQQTIPDAPPPKYDGFLVTNW